MPRIKLTDRALKALHTEKASEEFVDQDFKHGEFGVRISSSGRKSFFLRYRVSGKRRRLPLGTYPSLSLSEARTKALEAVIGVHDGKDPAKSREQKIKANSVAELYEAFMKQKESSFARTTYRNYWSMWRKDCEAILGDIRVSEVRRRHIVELLDDIESRTSGPHMVNRTRTMLMSLFNWAVAKDRCENNPVLGVPKAQKRERPVERFLSRDEIRVYWESAEQQETTERVYWRLLLLLALRPGEVKKLRWDWIDGNVLTIPASAVKNQRRHQLHLASLCQTELESLKRVSGYTAYLFPGVRDDDHRHDFTKAHKRMLKGMECPPWTPRDIRRTCETQMRTFIRDGEGISRVLNHDVSVIRKHYDRNDYFERKKEVLERWSSWLDKLFTEGSQKVVNLDRYR